MIFLELYIGGPCTNIFLKNYLSQIKNPEAIAERTHHY
jgi:hypothetical protein